MKNNRNQKNKDQIKKIYVKLELMDKIENK